MNPGVGWLAAVGRVALLGAVALSSPALAAQSPDEVTPDLLQRVFPDTERFGEREGDPPVYRAYGTDPATGTERLIGFVFHTADIPPETNGYSAPIRVLLGMDLTGAITSVHVTSYRESLRSSRGDFISRSGVSTQFSGKMLTDPFRVRQDVETISGATMTAKAMALGIRNAARRVAAAYMMDQRRAPSEPVPRLGTITLEELDRLTWPEMMSLGLVREITADEGGSDLLRITVGYLRDEAMAEAIIGPTRFAYGMPRIRERSPDEHMIFLGLNGPDILFFRTRSISFAQAGDTIRTVTEDFQATGLLPDGKAMGEFRRTGVLSVDRERLDPTRPFTTLVDLEDGRTISAEYQAYDSPGAVASAVAAGGGAGGAGSDPGAEPAFQLEFTEEQLAELLLEEELEEGSALARTLSQTSWARVAWLVALLALVTWAFVAKRAAAVRWAALAGTLGFLGFADRGFLSVSHILSGISAGPEVYLGDMSLLILGSFTLVTTFFWGRVFCGFLCPFGVLQDVLERVVPKRFKRELPRNVHEKALFAKYGVLAVVLAPAVLGLSMTVYHFFEPFGTVFYWSPSVLLWSITGGFLVASAIVPRFYCRYVCPLGAALAIGSLLSPFRIRRVEQCSVCKVCEQKCPTGAINGPDIDFKECVRCNECEIQLIHKTGVCGHDMEVIRPRLVRLKTAGSRSAA